MIGGLDVIGVYILVHARLLDRNAAAFVVRNKFSYKPIFFISGSRLYRTVFIVEDKFSFPFITLEVASLPELPGAVIRIVLPVESALFEMLFFFYLTIFQVQDILSIQPAF